MPEKAELTYCIVHYNKLNKLKNTIKYIEKHTPIPYQVYIWNNGYINSEIHKYLKKLDEKDNFHIWYCKTNLEPPAAKGKLISKADTKYIFSLDDDIYVNSEAIQTAIKIFEDNKHVGAVSFPLFTPEGELHTTSGVYINIINKVLYIERIPYIDAKQIIVDGIIAGGAMIFKKQFKKTFRFDPRYKITFGDLDRVLQSYYSNYNLLNCVSFKTYLIHDQTKNAEYLKVRRNYREHVASYMYFTRKWGLKLPFVEHILYRYIYAIPNREIVRVLNFGIRRLFNIKS